MREEFSIAPEKIMFDGGHAQPARMIQYFREGRLCDVQLKTEGDVFCGHRAVLAASSEYFDCRFASVSWADSKEQVIDLSLPDFAIEAVLEYIYTGKCTVTHAQLRDFLEVSSYLQVTQVLDWWASFRLKEDQRLDKCVVRCEDTISSITKFTDPTSWCHTIFPDKLKPISEKCQELKDWLADVVKRRATLETYAMPCVTCAQLDGKTDELMGFVEDLFKAPAKPPSEGWTKYVDNMVIWWFYEGPWGKWWTQSYGDNDKIRLYFDD